MDRLINIYKVPSSKIHYIPNGININEFNPNIDPSNLKSSLKINHHHPIILFVGRIFYLKGIKELILALSQIKLIYPEVLLLLIGPIRDRNYYQELQLKIKQKGGAGGHNGLKSIISHFSENFIRIKCGIGKPETREEVVNYVLGNFSKSNQETVDELIETASKAAKSVCTAKSIERVIEKYNRKK